MRKYHIMFNVTGKDFYSRGENFEADSIMEAYAEFRKHYPNAKFIMLQDLDTLDLLRIDRTTKNENADKTF